MTDLTTLSINDLKAIDSAADVAGFVLTGIWNEDDEKFAPAMTLLSGYGFEVEDPYDADQAGEAAKNEIRRREREEFYAKGPRTYSEDELIRMLQAAANRAYHINARPATMNQIGYLANLIVKADGRDPFSGNTNAVLTSKEASFMIDNYR